MRPYALGPKVITDRVEGVCVYSKSPSDPTRCTPAMHRVELTSRQFSRSGEPLRVTARDQWGLDGQVTAS